LKEIFGLRYFNSGKIFTYFIIEFIKKIYKRIHG